MKKLLSIFATLSMIVVPSSQLVSCVKVTNNEYKEPKDIAKYWNYKANNNVITLPTSLSKNNEIVFKMEDFYKELKTIIAFNFNNIKDEFKELEGIEFKFFLLKSVNSEIKNDVLEQMLSNIVKNVPIEGTLEVFFNYSLNGYEFKEFLDLKITNKFKFEEHLFKKSKLFKSLLRGKNENDNITISVPINKYFVSKIEKDLKDSKGQAINKESLKLFAKGIILSLEKTLNTKFANSIWWFRNENPHTKDEKPDDWRKFSANENLYLYYDFNDTGFLQIAEDLINNKASDATKLNTFLGMDEKTRIIFTLDKDI